MDNIIDIKCICANKVRRYKTIKGKYIIYCTNCNNSTRYRKTEEEALREWINKIAKQVKTNIQLLNDLIDYNSIVGNNIGIK